MKLKPILVIDIETTGREIQHEVVEIGCVVLDGKSLEEIDSFESLLRPLDLENADPKALEIHGIPEEELKAAPHPKAVTKNFVNFVKKYNSEGNKWGNPYVAGYNICNFDLPFLGNPFSFIGSPPKESLFMKYGVKEDIFDIRAIDLMMISWFWFAHDFEIRSISFGAICDKVGIEHKEAHRALSDARQEANYFKRMVELHKRIYPKVKWK